MEYYEIKNEIYEILVNSEYFKIYLGKADAYKIEFKNKRYTKKDALISLKEIHNYSYEEFIQNISDEISVLSFLNCNNIVKMIDIIEIKGKNYIAYEY